MSTDTEAHPRVWLRAFYGFDPEGAGYIGFTNPGDQRFMLENLREGDLILIYGAVESLTQKDLRAQALGFLEVTLEPVADRERMSATSYQWKIDNGFEDRWTHGIRVKRAWRVKNRVGISTIAPEAYKSENRFTRTTRAILLEEDERERALSHPVYEVSVFGEIPLQASDGPSGPMARVLRPSTGLEPTFGDQVHHREDGENTVYMMSFIGKPETVLGPRARPGTSLVKVGRTNDIQRRVRELNFGYPNPSHAGWKAMYTHTFHSAGRAHETEKSLKREFDTTFSTQSGEFFSGDPRAMEAAFHRICTEEAPVIKGAPGKARGV